MNPPRVRELLMFVNTFKTHTAATGGLTKLRTLDSVYNGEEATAALPPGEVVRVIVTRYDKTVGLGEYVYDLFETTVVAVTINVMPDSYFGPADWKCEVDLPGKRHSITGLTLPVNKVYFKDV